KPVIFDCIEFNKIFRHIDVLREIAFLCMDLEVYEKYTLSNHLVNKYNGGKLQDETYYLFTYYKSLCANVRAKVEILKIAQKENTSKTDMEEAISYINAMYSYSLM